MPHPHMPRIARPHRERTAADDGGIQLRQLHWVYQKYLVKYTDGGDDRVALDAAQFNASLPPYAADRVRLTFYHGCARHTPHTHTRPSHCAHAPLSACTPLSLRAHPSQCARARLAFYHGCARSSHAHTRAR